MPEAESTEDAPEAQTSKMPMIIGLVLAIVGGGGGFYATWSGMILGSSEVAEDTAAVIEDSLPDIAFVELAPIIVAISGADDMSHLRFRAQLEIPSVYKADVELLEPRIIDVMNSYLRAVRSTDISDPSALSRIRAQLLRRMQVVIGRGRVNDLLIMEFVIN